MLLKSGRVTKSSSRTSVTSSSISSASAPGYTETTITEGTEISPINSTLIVEIESTPNTARTIMNIPIITGCFTENSDIFTSWPLSSYPTQYFHTEHLQSVLPKYYSDLLQQTSCLHILLEPSANLNLTHIYLVLYNLPYL